MTDRVDQQDRDARLRAPDAAGHESTTHPPAGLPQEFPQRRGGQEKSRSLGADAWRDLIRNPIFIVSSLVALAIVSMAVAPWLWTNTNPHICNLTNSKQGPSPGHPFGFTIQGCDMYAQVIYGARPSIIIAVLSTLGTTVIGTGLGTLAAFYGGKIDTVISRATDIVFGLPFILGALLFLSIVNINSVWTIAAVLIALGWTQLTRIMRGSVLSIQHSDYVRAARGLGASNSRIIFRHILPNAIAPAIVMGTIALGGYVSAEATLTYLGVGLQLPEISWGILIAKGDSWAVSGYPHLLLFPCLFLVITVLAFILMGDAVRDAIDPKLR